MPRAERFIAPRHRLRSLRPDDCLAIANYKAFWPPPSCYGSSKVRGSSRARLIGVLTGSELKGAVYSTPRGTMLRRASSTSSVGHRRFIFSSARLINLPSKSKTIFATNTKADAAMGLAIYFNLDAEEY